MIAVFISLRNWSGSFILSCRGAIIPQGQLSAAVAQLVERRFRKA